MYGCLAVCVRNACFFACRADFDEFFDRVAIFGEMHGWHHVMAKEFLCRNVYSVSTWDLWFQLGIVAKVTLVKKCVKNELEWEPGRIVGNFLNLTADSDCAYAIPGDDL